MRRTSQAPVIAALRLRYPILAGAVLAALSAPAYADHIVVTLGEPHAEFPQFHTSPTGGPGICDEAAPQGTCVYGTETFQNWTGGGFTSAFMTGDHNFPAGTSLTGIYSGAISYDTNNTFGGTNGTAPYPAAIRSSEYNLALSGTGVPGVNYFGIWITAMDTSNLLRLHTASGQVLNFNSSVLKNYISADTTNGSQYYGNPDNGLDPLEPFAYVNFYDVNGYFTGIDVTNNGPSNFESSNHAAGYFSPLVIGGSPVPVPEPAGIGALAAGLIGMALGRRQRAAKPRASLRAC